MKQILFIAQKDFFYSLKEKSVLVWMFIMPIVFFGFIGSTTGGLGGSSNTKQNIAIWEMQAGETQSSPLAKQIVYRLEQENFNILVFNDETKLQENQTPFEQYTRRLWLLADIQKTLDSGEQVQIEYATKASGLGQDQNQFSIEKALYQTLGDVLLLIKSKSNHPNFGFDEVNKLPKNIKLEVSSAGEKLEIPNGFNQAVPGILVMFIMMIALTSGATSLYQERETGVLKRLAATPITRKQIILGKCLGKWFLAVLQLFYGMLLGWLVFNIYWGTHLFTIVLILLFWAAFNSSLAVLLGSLARSEGQVNAIATLSSLLLAALGGCWWPIEITPEWMQNLALFLPTGWIMDALHKLMYFGGTLQQVSLHIVALILLSSIALNFAYNKFKFS
jgi:ABC-type multidrug transport system permease subunit